MEPNFSGYVTKSGLECADGRVIGPKAFMHQDGATVPLVYQHNHDDHGQVMGKVVLSHKDDGVWGDAYLNETLAGKNADIMVKHGDLTKFSIWAKDLQESGRDVLHGVIQEVSLVLAGANPGANIANVLMHSGLDEDDNMMIVGFEIKHADTAVAEKVDEAKATEPPAAVVDDKKTETGSVKTIGDVLATLTDEQKLAVNATIDDVLKEAVTEAVTEVVTNDPNLEHDNLDSKKGTEMTRNVFDESKKNHSNSNGPELKHDDMKAILDRAKGPDGKGGDNAASSLRSLVRSKEGQELLHADTYGIQNIEVLFPDAQQLMRTPTWVDRRQDWVKKFMAGTSHSPFARVKTTYADITAEEARARGYIKGHQKVDEVFPVFKRTTGPAWIYKRQKLDREDIINVTDFDVVAWMKAEMRGKLDEEIARAGLFGDGRPTMIGSDMNPDKIKDPGAANTSGDGIRAIVADNDLYTATYDVALPANPSNDDWNILLDTVTESSEFYLGSGNKTAFVGYRTASKLLTMRDAFGKRQYRNLSEVAGDMDVNEIVRVPTELMPNGVLAIVLDLADYNFGTDRGGEVTLFDDFDIDFNQFKYLIETYLSGALTLPYSAQVFKATLNTNVLIVPAKPVVVNNVITIPTQTGTVYKRTDTGATLSNGSTLTLDSANLKTVDIEASPSNGYYYGDNRDATDTNTFKYKA